MQNPLSAVFPEHMDALMMDPIDGFDWRCASMSSKTKFRWRDNATRFLFRTLRWKREFSPAGFGTPDPRLREAMDRQKAELDAFKMRCAKLSSEKDLLEKQQPKGLTEGTGTRVRNASSEPTPLSASRAEAENLKWTKIDHDLSTLLSLEKRLQYALMEDLEKRLAEFGDVGSGPMYGFTLYLPSSWFGVLTTCKIDCRIACRRMVCITSMTCLASIGHRIRSCSPTYHHRLPPIRRPGVLRRNAGDRRSRCPGEKGDVHSVAPQVEVVHLRD